MLQDIPGSTILAVLVALVPALARAILGRSLLRLTDDPLLPERLVALQTRIVQISVACTGLLIVGWTTSLIWTIPLMVVTEGLAAFRLRRALFQETWSVAGWLVFRARMWAAFIAFWLLLTATPLVTFMAGRFDLVVACTLALLLAAWMRYRNVVTPALIRVRPIADARLMDRFAAIVALSGITPPRFARIPLNGGVLANAFALPSLRGSSVVFTDTLLERLSEDEVVAICAHEIAHLEHYDRRLLGRMALLTYGLILTSAAVSPIARRIFGLTDGSDLRVWLGLGCLPAAVFIGLMLAGQRRQRHETASDVRGVALTGDAEALASALIKIHAIARVPRRWDQVREQESTHPSLARRIRDIRASVQAVPAAFDTPVSFPSASGLGGVTFETSCIDWRNEAGITERLEYTALIELRLHASPSGTVTLTAADRGGRKWRMGTRADDVPALHTILDLVDGRLVQDIPLRPFSAVVAHLVAALAAGLALLVGQTAFAIAATLAFFSPAAFVLNAAGAAGVTAAILELSGMGVGSDSVGVLWLTLGFVFLALGRVRQTGDGRMALATMELLTVITLAVVVSIGATGFNPIRVHQAARATPGALVLLSALAAAAWTWRRRRGWRYVALAAASTAILLVTVATTAFLERVGRDPFLTPAAAFTGTDVRAHAAEFAIPFEIDWLRLSPNGRRVAVTREGDRDRTSPARAHNVFHVTGRGSELTPIEGDDFAFIDDDRALVLAMANGSGELRDVAIDTSAVAWRHPLPDLREGVLAFDHRSRRWTVTGSGRADRFVRITGVAGTTEVHESSWSLPHHGDAWTEGLTTRDDTLIAVETSPGLRLTTRRGGWLRSLVPALFTARGQSSVWTVRGGEREVRARSFLDTTCDDDGLDGGLLVCAVFDGTTTRVLTFAPDAGLISAVGRFEGRFRIRDVQPDGWIAGWTGKPAALQLTTRSAYRLPDEAGGVYDVAVTNGFAATAAWHEPGTRIRVFALNERGPAGR